MSQVRAVIGALNDFTSRVITALSVNITAELIERTPVDTGWARANWIPRIGDGDVQEQETEAVEALVPGRRAEQSSAVAALAAGGYDVSQGPIFIGNGVPYIVRLNEGSSRQAPAGFVQQSIPAGIRRTSGASVRP